MAQVVDLTSTPTDSSSEDDCVVTKESFKLFSTPVLKEKSSQTIWKRRQKRKSTQQFPSKKRKKLDTVVAQPIETSTKSDNASKDSIIPFPESSESQISSLLSFPPQTDDMSWLDIFTVPTDPQNNLGAFFSTFTDKPNQSSPTSVSTSSTNSAPSIVPHANSTSTISTNQTLNSSAIFNTTQNMWMPTTNSTLNTPNDLTTPSNSTNNSTKNPQNEFTSLSNPETVPVLAGDGTWVWWNNYEFVHFSADLNEAIERDFKAGHSLYNFSIVSGGTTTNYTIFFDKFIQTNNHTKYTRQVQRLCQIGGPSFCEIPVNRFNVDQTFTIQYPAEWERQEDICELKQLSYQCPEWIRIEKLIHASLNTVDVVSIHRIQNQHLWRRYFFERQFVQQKNGGNANELELFHGSRSTDPVEIFNGEEGFDMRYSNQGRWGIGIYFASKAVYSINYAYCTKTGLKQLLLSRVATGSAYSCLEGDTNLRTPPAKRGSNSRIPFSTDFYDSVVGMINHTQIFTVYSNSKAYPAYLITFQDNNNIAP